MLIIKDKENCNVFVSEDIFEEITEAILSNLKNRRGIGQELNSIQDRDPEIYIEIVEESANTIHKEITNFINKNYLNDPPIDENMINMKNITVHEARLEITKLFNRNMNKIASE